MSRWKVARHEVTSWLGTSYQWCVMDADNWQILDFNTWREALDYADRMARTREVVLPRGPYEIRSEQNIYEGPIKVESIKHFPGHETVAVKYTTHGVPAGFFLAADEVLPLALALAALAERQEAGE